MLSRKEEQEKNQFSRTLAVSSGRGDGRGTAGAARRGGHAKNSHKQRSDSTIISCSSFARVRIS